MHCEAGSQGARASNPKPGRSEASPASLRQCLGKACGSRRLMHYFLGLREDSTNRVPSSEFFIPEQKMEDRCGGWGGGMLLV